MTNVLRIRIAKQFRQLLDRGVLKKKAILTITDKYGISRITLYRNCERAGIDPR